MPYDWLTGQAVALPYAPRPMGSVSAVMAAAQPLGLRPRPGSVPYQHSPGIGTMPSRPPVATVPYQHSPGRGTLPQGRKPTPQTTKTTTAKTGIPTLDMLIRQIYGTIETPAQQEARVNREINAQMAAQQKMIGDMYARQRADALAIMQGQSLAGQAAAAMNKDLFASVGGEYNAAAGEIKGLAHGLSQNAAGATAGDVSKANAALGALGNAPVAEGGTFGVGGETQRGVEEYRGGTLPGQMFGTQGEAAQFGLAGMTSAMNLRATQEAEAELHTTLQDLRGKESDAINALAAGRLDLYHQYKNEAADARVKSLSLVQGLIAQKQANAQATAKLVAQAQRDALSMSDKDRKFALSVAKAKQGAAATATRLDQAQTRIEDARTVNEARLAIANANLRIAQRKAMMTAVKAMQESGQVDVNKSKALGYVVGKDGKPILDAGGKQIPSSMLSKSTKKAPSATTVMKANDLIKTWRYGYKTVGAVPAANGKPGKPGKRVPAWQAPGFDENDPRTWGQTGATSYVTALSTLTNMGFSRTKARNMLNTIYERGDQGRPIFSSEEQAAIKQRVGRKEYERMVLQIRKALNRGSIQQAQNWIATVLGGGSFYPGYSGGVGSPAG